MQYSIRCINPTGITVTIVLRILGVGGYMYEGGFVVCVGACVVLICRYRMGI